MAKAPDEIQVGNPVPDEVDPYTTKVTTTARSAYADLPIEEQTEFTQATLPIPGQDPIVAGLDPRRQAAEGAFTQKVVNTLDTEQEAQFQEYARNYPPNIAFEARKYWIAKPHLDFDYIAKNLAEVRAQVQAENFDWETARESHPILHEYLKDPATATQAMQQSAFLTGADRWLGGVVPPLKGSAPATDQSVDDTMLESASMHESLHSPGYAPPFWVAMAVDAFKNDVPALSAGIAKMASDVLDDMVRTHYDDGTPIPESKQPFVEGRKTMREFWDPTVERLSRETTGTKDYLGPTPEGAWHSPQKLARGMEIGVGFIAQSAPLLVGAALSGGASSAASGAARMSLAHAAAGARGVFMLNTVYSAAGLYPRLKDATGSTPIAAALTLAGAPVIGKIMGFTPTGNAMGARAYKWIESGVGKAAAGALESESWRRLTRIVGMKMSYDYLVGSFAFAAQSAAEASIEQLALSFAGRDVNGRAIMRAAGQGWRDSDAMLLMSIYGSSRHLITDVGRTLRSKDMIRRVDEFRAELAKVTGDPAFREEALKKISGQEGRDRTFYLPLQKFNEAMEKAGYKPREVAAVIHGDGGEAYDKAVAYFSEHLAVPIEKMEKVLASKVTELADLAANEGKLDPELMSRVEAQKVSDEFKIAFDAALKVKPGEMSEGDKAMYDALLAFAESDKDVAQQMFAQISALGTRHPDFTTQEIFDMTFGAEGVAQPLAKDRRIKTLVEVQKPRRIDPETGLPFAKLVFAHSDAPVQLTVKVDPVGAWDPKAKTWVAEYLGFASGVVDAEGGLPKAKAKFGGRGLGDDIYLEALAKAQRAGVAWASDSQRSALTKRRYARLTKLGIPFRLIETEAAMFGGKDRYIISAEDLQKVDFAKVNRTRVEVNKPLLDRIKGALGGKGKGPIVDSAGRVYVAEAPVDQALRIAQGESGIFDDTLWHDAFQGSKEWSGDLVAEQRAFEHSQLIRDMQRLARERVEVALKAGVRSQVATERAKFEAVAREEIKKDPAQRAQHFFQTGELWGDASRLAMLIGEDGKPLRLLDTEVDALMGPGAAAALKAEKRSLITSDPRKAIDVDAAANALGYPGSAVAGEPARKLLAGLRDALTDGQFVKEWADLKVREALRSELLDNPAELAMRITDSVQNEKVVAVLLSRLRATGDQLDPARKERASLPAEFWVARAEGIVQSKALGDLKPEQFVKAMKKSAERALEALREGDLAKAWDATEAQLLNHYAYRLARENEKSLGAMYAKVSERATSDRWRSLLGKADPSYRALSDGLLGAMGIGDVLPTAGLLEKFKEQVVANFQDDALAMDLPGASGWDSKVIASVMDGGRKWTDLTPSEAAEVFKAVKNIHHIAKRQTAELVSLKAADTYNLINNAERYLSGLAAGVEGPSLKGHNPIPQDVHAEASEAVKKWKKAAAIFGWGGAYLDSPRVILGYLGDEMQSRIYNDGFINARVTESDLIKSLYEPWKETQKIWENDPDFHKVLPGLDESHLAYTGLDESGKEVWVDRPGVKIHGLDGPVTKKYLIQMVKWLGSESGREKLLKGMGIDYVAVLEAAGRYLHPYEVEAIQAEHKFLDEKLAPLKAAAHERRTGLPWEQVKSMEYTITFGDGTTRTFSGGYYPVHWDKREGVNRQFVRAGEPREGVFNPKVPDGSFKERTGFVGVPDLNWANMPAHLLADVHNLAFGDFVQDANRVLLNPTMLNVIRRHLGDEYAEWPRAWLDRVAQESSGHVPGHLAGVNEAVRYSRSALTVGALGLNLPLMAGDLAHPIATALMRDGVAMSVTYAAPAMSKVLENYANMAITGVNPLRDEIHSKSKVVPLRANELPSLMSRWYHGSYERSAEPGFLESASRVRDAVSNTAFWHLRLSDAMVSEMIWEAKYRKTLDETGDEAVAIRAGDDQVLAAMPDYSVMATPSILADSGSFRAVGLIFHSYWSKLLEMSDEQRHKMVIQPSRVDLNNPSGPSKVTKSMHAAQWAGRTLAMLTAGAVAGDFLQGQGKQEDEDWLTWFKRKQAAAPLKLFPYASTLFGPTIDATFARGASKAQKVQIAIPFYQPVERSINAINAALFDHRKMDEDKVFDLVGSALMMSGLPSNAPVRAARYGYAVASGKERPRGGFDYASGLGYGERYGKSRRYRKSTPLKLIQTIFDEGK